MSRIQVIVCVDLGHDGEAMRFGVGHNRRSGAG
jgi:hypothetical protein